jgi:hypothetical protein
LQPVTLVRVSAPPVMVTMMVFSGVFFVVTRMVAIVVAVTGMPPGMPAAVVLVWGRMEITPAQDNRVCAVGMGHRYTPQQQASREQGRSKQVSGFHESDSFSGYLRMQ